jgi:hypothetical protein
MADIKITQVTKENLPQLGKSPLGVLDTSDNSLSILKYPSNLGNKADSNEKKHWVTFRIYDIEPASLSSATTGLTNNKTVLGVGNVGTGVAIAGAAAAGTIGAVIATIAAKTKSDGSLSGSLAKGASVAAGAGLAVGALLAAAGLGTGFTVSPPTSTTKSIISLYMPDSLVARYDAQYDEMSLTKDLGPAITTLRAIDSAGQNIGGGNGIAGNPAIVQSVTGLSELTGKSIPGVDLQNLGTLLQRAQGYALNPQLQMIYRGTGLRTFQLSFTFTPKSRNEAQAVNNIINQFRFYSSPSLGQKVGEKTTTTTNSMFLIPPSLFDIEFYVNGEPSEYLPKYGRCILDNVDINHAPNGFAVYDDGSMVQTTLELAFKEMDILTRDSFNDKSRR